MATPISKKRKVSAAVVRRSATASTKGVCISFFLCEAVILTRPSLCHFPPRRALPQFVADGVFFAELNEFLTRELAEDGYSGVEVRVTPMRTEIIIRATKTQAVLGEKGRRIRELTSLVTKRFKFGEGTVELYAEKVRVHTSIDR